VGEDWVEKNGESEAIIQNQVDSKVGHEALLPYFKLSPPA